MKLFKLMPRIVCKSCLNEVNLNVANLLHVAHAKRCKLQRTFIKNYFNTRFFYFFQGSTNLIGVGFDVKTLTLVEVVHNVDVSMIQMGGYYQGFDGVVVGFVFLQINSNSCSIFSLFALLFTCVAQFHELVEYSTSKVWLVLFIVASW